MLIDEIFQEIRLVFRKQRKGTLQDSEITTAVTLACKELYGELLEKLREGKSFPSSLDPFRVTAALNFASASTIAHPIDMSEIVSLSQTAEPKRIGIIYSDDVWEDTVNSSLLEGEDTFARKSGANIISNQTLTDTTIGYIKLPTSWFVYATDVDGDGRGTTFNGGNSTDLEFKTADAPRLQAKAMLTLGLSLQDQASIQVGAAKDR